MHTSHLIPALTTLLLCGGVACGDPVQQDDTPDMSAAMDQGREDMPATLDMQATGDLSEPPDLAAPDDMQAIEDMNNSDDMEEADLSESEDMPASAHDVPATSDEVFVYLQAGRYMALPAEPAIHASTGPHGRVRTFVNDALATSIRAGDTTHPVGSASIKELYSSSDALTGWAVSVKVSDTSSDGKDWYWYEVFSTTQNNPVADATGAGLCTGCHSGGTDFVLTPGPFTP